MALPLSAARSIRHWGHWVIGPNLRLVASTTLRNLVLITVALLLVFVLLPAALSAQWASAG